MPVRPGKTTEVLIRLALEAGHPVRTDRLIEDLWNDAAPTTARNTLQTKVSALRRSLEDAAVVTGTGAGYTLEIDAGAVDALEAPRLAEVATSLLNSGDAAAALDTCTTALAMFRGDVLCDAGDGDWLLPHRVRLEEVRLRLVEDQLAARIALGAAGEVTGELEALVGTYPLREGLWELLITALYRDGRQADALAAYTRVRTLLAEELGLEPGPALRELEQRVLEHDPLLAATLAPARATSRRCHRHWSAVVTNSTRSFGASEANGSSHWSARPAWARRGWRSKPPELSTAAPAPGWPAWKRQAPAGR